MDLVPLSEGEQYDYLRNLLEPLDRTPRLNAITVRLRTALQEVYIVEDFLHKLQQLVREWINILEGAENCPELNAIRRAIARHTIYPVRLSDFSPGYSTEDSEPIIR